VIAAVAAATPDRLLDDGPDCRRQAHAVSSEAVRLHFSQRCRKTIILCPGRRTHRCCIDQPLLRAGGELFSRHHNDPVSVSHDHGTWSPRPRPHVYPKVGVHPKPLQRSRLSLLGGPARRAPEDARPHVCDIRLHGTAGAAVRALCRSLWRENGRICGLAERVALRNVHTPQALA
jgi:hypothetical protein